ncbi:NAD(P)-dependent oxidoreductase [Vulcanococcus sp.]|uniref:NAD(P)-dependent oxidoreductase n=1 Tax=Vulcanococcus sp. TaxID=2856995 RepID=UPI003C122D08
MAAWIAANSRSGPINAANADPKPQIAFLGLGALGAPMARNLIQAGFAVTVFNRTPDRMEPLLQAGAEGASNPADAVRQADLVLLCLSDDAAVLEVLEQAQGSLAPGSLVVDFSTISPATSQQLATALGAQGLAYIDAPVTGGTEGAKAGTLAVLVGAAAEHLERARPVLEVIGGSIHHFGPVGAGQQAKAVNQVLVAGSYAAVAEALALADRLGLPQEQLVQALKGGAAGSWALEHRSRNMIEDQFPLGFKLALHRKDLGIALSAAANANLTLPITDRVAALEDVLIEQGYGELDVSALARWFRA